MRPILDGRTLRHPPGVSRSVDGRAAAIRGLRWFWTSAAIRRLTGTPITVTPMGGPIDTMT